MATTSNKNWALDTNILIYLLDGQSPFYSHALAVIHQAADQHMQLCITQQNIVELVQTLTHWYHLPLAQAIDKAEHLTVPNLTVLTPTHNTMSLYFELCSKAGKSPKHHFDLYLAATLLSRRVATLITNNPQDFSSVPNFKAIPLTDFS